MAKFLIEVPDGQAAALVQAFCVVHSYQPTVLDGQGLPIPNPMTPNKFWTDKTAEFWQNTFDQYKQIVGEQAAATARTDALEALPDFTVELTAEAV